ncbi:MAG: hypothetical protein ACREIE_05125 [Nitrospiraceae bacterium]
MRTWCVVLVVVWVGGCASAMKRDGQCLASLAPEFVNAHEELASLEASWRAALRRRDVELGSLLPPFAPKPDHPVSPLVPLPPESDLVARQEQARRAEGRAYADLIDAKVRHRPTLEWYGKVSERFRTRLDEEQILSEVRMVLVTGPGLIFYPIVLWNIHSVMWDGTDPDAESDPVTRYCADRLSKPVASAAHPLGQGE